MTNSDIPIVREKVNELQHLSPMLFGGGNDRNVVRGDKNGTYRVKGCYPVRSHREEYDALRPVYQRN